VVFKLEDDKNAAVATSLTEVTTPRVEEKIAIEPEVVDAMEPVLIVRDEVTSNVEDVVSFAPESSEKVVFNLDSDFPSVELNNDSSDDMTFEMESEPVVASNDNDVFNFRAEAEAVALKDEEESRIIENQPKEEVLTPEQEMFRRSRERIMRLKELSYKMNSPNGISDLEKEPAYKRRNVRLENVPNSADSSVSRLTLSVDDADRKPEIRANNSFLHDRVD
jgi:cell division protein FtsZ